MVFLEQWERQSNFLIRLVAFPKLNLGKSKQIDRLGRNEFLALLLKFKAVF